MKPQLPSRNFWIAFGLLLVATLSCAIFIFGNKGLLELHRLRREAATIERGNQELLKRNQALARRVASLRDDPAEIERLARKRLGMIKEGEVVYYLPGQASGPAAPGEQPGAKPAPM